MVETPPPLPTDEEPTQTESEATPETPPVLAEETETENTEISTGDPAADPYESLFEGSDTEEKLGATPPPLPEPRAFEDVEEDNAVNKTMPGIDYDATPEESGKKLDTKWIIAIVVGIILLLLCCCCATLVFFWTFGDEIFGLSLVSPTPWLL